MKSMANSGKSTKQIGKWSYDPEYRRFIHLDGREFFLDNRLNKLLKLLLEQKEKILKRGVIIDLVWKDVQVNEESLTKGIFDLRKVLKEKDVTEIEILTIRNIGYRLQITEAPPRNKRIFRLLLKAAVYFIAFLSFAILFIRAIRYEN